MIYTCNSCNAELTYDNWPPSWKMKGNMRCTDCLKKTNTKNNPKHNPQRMFVNGKYILKSHPLYKPGNYRTFNDAAFSVLFNEKSENAKEGYVYVISNTSWPSWYKIGMAIDAEDRLNSYQTSSPFRNYVLEYSRHFVNRRSAESIAHRNIGKVAEIVKGEWFYVDKKTAINIIEEIVNETNT